MSRENIEIARHAAEAIDRRDRTAWLALHDQDCEVVAMDDWSEAGVRGAEAAWSFYGTVFDALDRVTGPSGIGDVQLVDAGAGQVLVHLRNDLSGRESGAGVEFNYWVVVTIRQGEIVREHWFADHAEALEAAGLSE
jgi:ketosteroid isomerase-like protein